MTAPNVIKQGALLFPMIMFSATLGVAQFVLSWREAGMWPLVTGLLLSVVVTVYGQALRYHFRARSIVSGVPERASQRVAAFALLCAGLTMTGATLWRGLN